LKVPGDPLDDVADDARYGIVRELGQPLTVP
jgi:hypothetical protein